MATDPRWGRLAENFGEDPLLVSLFGLAELQGIQGEQSTGPDVNASTYMVDPTNHPICQVKHFAAYGAFSKDSYTTAVQVSEAALFGVYLRPWLHLGTNGLRAVMVSHNVIDSTPMHGNKHMLTDVLRNRFGLSNGYIGSDSGNVYANAVYGVAADAADASVLWLTSGGDQAMLDMCLGAPNATWSADADSPCNTARLVNMSLLAQSVLDRAVANVLRPKFAAGLFDSVGVPDSSVINSNAARALARHAAAEGIVLLQNNGILPVQNPAARKWAVLGTNGGCGVHASREAALCLLQCQIESSRELFYRVWQLWVWWV